MGLVTSACVLLQSYIDIRKKWSAEVGHFLHCAFGYLNGKSIHNAVVRLKKAGQRRRLLVKVGYIMGT